MKNRLGIFRALDVRFTHAEFAGAFHTFTPVFIADIPLDIKQYLTHENIQYYDAKLVPQLLFDPIYPLLQKTDFTPWKKFNNNFLELITKEIRIYEIYEPYFFYSSQIANLAKKKGVPLVTEIWTSFPEHPARYFPPYSFNVKTVIKQTDLFILRSKKALSYLHPYKIPVSKTAIIYHGINIERFFPAKNNHEGITLLFVGALASHKGIDDLLDVFEELVVKYPNKLQLIICGDGPFRNRVLNIAKKLPIKYVGKVSNLALPEIYRSADIYCQPSKDYYFMGIKGGEEFAGYTFMEALASGLPVVTTNCGGIPEIVGEDNCFIDQGNRKQLFESLETYINNSELRKEIGIKNRMRAEQLFDLSKQVKKLETIIVKKLL